MKKLAFTVSILLMTAFAQAQVIEQTYHFSKPSVTVKEGYQLLELEGCLPTGQVGEPTIPWHSISLMLPQGQEALSMSVDFLDYVELEGEYQLFPHQQARPLSSDENIPFAKNQELYRSNQPYPTRNYSTVSTQYLNGVAFAFGGFTPIQYIPSTGKVQLARTVRVRIETTTSRDDHSGMLWLTPENQASIKHLAQNDAMLDSYNRRGREVSGYDMLVITSEEWMARFGDYLDLYNSKGIRTQIVSLEQIYATMDGRDQQEQIRNYIIQEYQGNGISMVCLGGDVAIVPYRSLWCFAQEGYEDQLPADMYYACLDGTLNDDNDDRWGEVGEDDLLPELGIGRLPFNNEEQFQTIMHKTFSYLQTPVLGEFTSPILGAEHLGDGYYGSDDMERLVGTNSDYGYTTHGYTPNYNIKRYYETHSKPWRGNEFRQVIGTGGQYVHHVGHANTGTVAGWDINSMGNNYFQGNDGINHNFMLFHSHGCICGDFSHGCILEKMVTIPTGFVVTTGNSRYGWYEPWGDGMAAHIHREFVDAYCHDHIPTVGMALREAKIATAPWVTNYGENGCLRWNIYCLNVLGDVALYPWFDEPFNPNVVFEQGLPNGTTSTQVHVSQFDTPLDNYTVSLFDGETLLARAITDANGNAVLNFSPALNVNGDMQLVVTGQSAWPQTFQVCHIDDSQAFIYGNINGFNGEPLFGTQSLWVSGDLYNNGAATANQVHAGITTDCDYIFIDGDNFTIDVFEPNSTLHFDHLGDISIANNIPDQTLFTLYLTTYVGDITHTTQRSFLAKAPNLQFIDFEVDDSMGDGNGYADPGEQVNLNVNCKNIGHALASGAALTITCDNPSLHLTDEVIQLNDINPNDAFTVPVGFYTDASLINGTLIHLNMELQYGEYTTVLDHIINIGLIQETFESGDFSYTNWEHSGNASWFITDEEAHSGSYCARSGEIGNSQESHLIVHADILEDSEIGFWFKTSTENHKDGLIFYLDNQAQGLWSGENGWTYFSASFEAGSHDFQWTYHKGSSGSAGADCVWIDDITFPRSTVITGVEEIIPVKKVSLYPNPSNGTFTINLPEESDIEIINMLGQKLMTCSKVSGNMELQLDQAGLYLVRVNNASGTETLKLIVK